MVVVGSREFRNLSGTAMSTICRATKELGDSQNIWAEEFTKMKPSRWVRGRLKLKAEPREAKLRGRLREKLQHIEDSLEVGYFLLLGIPDFFGPSLVLLWALMARMCLVSFMPSGWYFRQVGVGGALWIFLGLNIRWLGGGRTAYRWHAIGLIQWGTEERSGSDFPGSCSIVGGFLLCLNLVFVLTFTFPSR